MHDEIAGDRRATQDRSDLFSGFPDEKGDEALPGAHSSRIDVHEVGSGIVPDAAAPNCERGLPQRGEWHVSEADIDRLPLHVEAAGRDALAPVSKHVVGRG